MWLRDFLPKQFPQLCIWTYGYDFELRDSWSVAEFEDHADHFRRLLRRLRQRAAKKGRDAVMTILLNRQDIDVNSRDEAGRTPLYWAAQNQHEAAVRLLLSGNGDCLKSTETDNLSSLLWEGFHDSSGMVQFLLRRRDFDIECENCRSQTPLFWTFADEHTTMTRVLLDRGANASHKDLWGRTPLFLAAGNSSTAIAQMLLQKGIDADCQDNYGRTPLSRTAVRGNLPMVRLLLEQENMNANSRDLSGRSPLFWAAGGSEAKCDAVVRLLLEHDVDMEGKDHEGKTTLSWAIEKGNKRIVQLLISRGASLD